jgi:uridine kinase
MKPYIIGITGGSGSGKTLFIRKSIENYDDEEVCFISQDNYYRPREDQPVDKNGVLNFDLPESIDNRKFVNDIRKLLKGNSISIQEYTFNILKPEPAIIEISPAPVIIIEGIFILYTQEICKLIDLKIFMEAREHIMLKRRIIRDMEERGYDLEEVLYRYENHVMPAFNSYILPYKDDCNIIINNHSNFNTALKVMNSYISSLLKNKRSGN